MPPDNKSNRKMEFDPQPAVVIVAKWWKSPFAAVTIRAVIMSWDMPPGKVMTPHAVRELAEDEVWSLAVRIGYKRPRWWQWYRWFERRPPAHIRSRYPN